MLSKKQIRYLNGVGIFHFLVHSDSTGENLVNKNETYHESTGESSLPLVAKIVGPLLALLCLSGILLFAYRRKSR